MITKKIMRRDDDHNRVGRGCSKDEEAALRELTRTRPNSQFKIGAGSRSGSRTKTKRRQVNRTLEPRMRAQHKRDFRQLTAYLVEGRESKNGERAAPSGEGRVEFAAAFNTNFFDGERLTAEQISQVAEQMGETAALNTRMQQSASLHYVVSLPASDRKKATSEFWNEYTREALNALGMTEHQALLVVHCDTGSPHMHLAINKVHPTSARVNDPSFDLVKLQALNRNFEKRYGLKVTPGRWIDPKTGNAYDWEKVRTGEIILPRKRRNKSPASMKKFAREVAENLGQTKPFSTAKSWDELENALQKHRYYLRAEGRGMVIENSAGDECKLTQVSGKGLGREKLQQRFRMTWERYRSEKYDRVPAITPEQRKMEFFEKRRHERVKAKTKLRATEPIQKEGLVDGRETQVTTQHFKPSPSPRILGDRDMSKPAKEKPNPSKPYPISIGTHSIDFDNTLRIKGLSDLKIVHLSLLDGRKKIDAMSDRMNAACLTMTSKAHGALLKALESDPFDVDVRILIEGLERAKTILRPYGEQAEIILELEAYEKPAPSTIEPIRFDDEGLANYEINYERKQAAQRRLQAMHDKFAKMCEAELEATLKVTRQWAFNAKKIEGPAGPKERRLFDAGERILKAFMREHGLKIPANHLKKQRTKTRGVEF
ncbi:relaxase/mobilization nuclease domain-containing protein [Varunaivibrio sulfuroxidans]|uniref:Relaxase/mobilization nuclease-like protein n=1 Tax=Varunaivibrio sulfuroxidans TaxID=1773489 RepID=A0A4R3J806_9PROT|nr:relaxase/mobilization nuclease domain-containing protein [Varunaivibrio sulfuroxidans]TCS61597.1 relaxase/mobilization nuclease-like protein [Varunaivibrio sulfuroxidans]WES29528.1 relaxase/mobilization nuclease domain-containing protein [Varunaivibrio sulfuroxidans]